jgi:Leucine-rich repeat (LRR) protein
MAKRKKICPACNKSFVSPNRHKCNVDKNFLTLNLFKWRTGIVITEIKNIKNVSLLPYDFEGSIYVNSIENCINLKDLNVSNHSVSQINALETLINLKKLTLFKNLIKSIQGLENNKKLRVLDLQFNQIQEITGLENLKNLNSLFLNDNEIKELKGLENLIKLERLWIGKNKISEIKNLNALGRLKVLDFGMNRITRIKNLNHLKNLESLNLSYNQISEIEGLGDLTNLKKLDLSYNNYISNITGLDKLNKLLELKLIGNNIHSELLEKLGGLAENGLVKNPQRFIDYCKKNKSGIHITSNNGRETIQTKLQNIKTKKRKKISTINIRALHKFLLDKLWKTQSSTNKESPLTGETKVIPIGIWFWIKSRLHHEYSTWDWSTDRASGDPRYNSWVKDWIGLIENAPKKVSLPKDLDNWALFKASYFCESGEVGGDHRGRWVENFEKDGMLTVHNADGNFYNVPSINATWVQKVDLKRLERWK